jgi:uncharacterized protein YdaU (DUF1376 family)
MHYYKRNLGDYYQKAGRLSMLQHGSYTLLIDACYDREKFPTLEEAKEWAWASSSAEIEAVEFVLNKFFTIENGVYVQSRIREEIEKYHSNAATNKRIADERETKRKENNTNRVPTVNEAPPNQEPVTNNHKPTTKESKDLSPPSATTTPKGTRLPEDWKLSKEWGEWAMKEKPMWTADDVRRVADDFKDHWLANANKANAKKADWMATWRKWVRSPLNEIKKTGYGQIPSSAPPLIHKCGYAGCDRNSNLTTSKGHRCTEHMSK